MEEIENVKQSRFGAFSKEHALCVVMEWFVKGSVLGSPHEARKFDNRMWKGKRFFFVHFVFLLYSLYSHALISINPIARGVPDADKNPSDPSRLRNWRNKTNFHCKDCKDCKTLKSILFSSSASSCVKISLSIWNCEETAAADLWRRSCSPSVHGFWRRLVRWSCFNAKVCCQKYLLFAVKNIYY